MTKTVVVTIDGPAGAGKSTVAKALARELNYFYLDTGAMYRALTLKALRQGIDLENNQRLVELADQTAIELKGSPKFGLQVYLDGHDVSEDIRTVEVTNKTFYIARNPQLRSIMVAWQRQIAQNKNIVVDGRDAGTVIFPSAAFKFYLDADITVRARRRTIEIREKGIKVENSKIIEEMRDRDQKDISRKVGPLKKAEDAVVIDSTKLTVEQVVAKMRKIIDA